MVSYFFVVFILYINIKIILFIDFCLEFLSVYNLDHKTAHLQPRGLTNRNTRCYINATLQALLTCPPFFNLMRSVQFKLKNRNNRGQQKTQTPILESMYVVHNIIINTFQNKK